MDNVSEQGNNRKPCCSYREMSLAAIGAVNDESGSTEDVISQYISSFYTDLPPDHSDLVRVNLSRMIDEKLIGIKPAYFIKDPNASFSDHTPPLHVKIIEAIKNYGHKDGATEIWIAEYIGKRSGKAESSEFSSDQIIAQLEKLVEGGVIGVNNLYYLMPQGRAVVNCISVPFYNDDSFQKWKRRRIEDTTEGASSTQWEESDEGSEAEEGKIKEGSMARIMEETKPRTLPEDWTPQNPKK